MSLPPAHAVYLSLSDKAREFHVEVVHNSVGKDRLPSTTNRYFILEPEKPESAFPPQPETAFLVSRALFHLVGSFPVR